MPELTETLIKNTHARQNGAPKLVFLPPFTNLCISVSYGKQYSKLNTMHTIVLFGPVFFFLFLFFALELIIYRSKKQTTKNVDMLK